MSRIPLIEPAAAPPEVRESYAEIEAMGFPVFNVMKMLAHNAEAFRGFVHVMRALYHAPRVSPRYRELAYLRASQVNSCHY
ncbi:MAG: carboxymuconolactone decarboxylase family protein [Gammaproteobacteria bacterium]